MKPPRKHCCTCAHESFVDSCDSCTRPRACSRPRGHLLQVDLRQQILRAPNASRTYSNSAGHCPYVHERPSDSKSYAPQMLRVHIQIVQATVRTSMNDLQLDLTKRNPLRGIDCTLRYVVMIPACAFGFCPRPCNVQLLEIHVRASPTQSARIGLHAKQGELGTLSTRNAYQHVLALLHQVESLTMNVLQVWITSCPCRGRRLGALEDVRGPDAPVGSVGAVLPTIFGPHRPMGPGLWWGPKMV